MDTASVQRIAIKIAFLLFLWPELDVGAQNTLSICTFNCEFLTRPKVHIKFGHPFRLTGALRAQWDQPGFRDARFREAAQVVARVIAGIDVDVVALTEVGNETDVIELQQEVRNAGVDYQHRAVCQSTDPNRQFVAVLSKFPLTNVLRTIPGTEHYLEEPDDPDSENDTRISKGMRVTFAAHGETFHLYVSHLISERGGHESDAQRVAQASIVRRHYLEVLNSGGHVIVAGDLNDKRGQPALRRIRGLEDIWGDLIQTGREPYFDPMEVDTRWTFEFKGTRGQIDHLLISRSIREITGASGISTRTVDPGPGATNGPTPSDHRALVVTLRL